MAQQRPSAQLHVARNAAPRRISCRISCRMLPVACLRRGGGVVQLGQRAGRQAPAGAVRRGQQLQFAQVRLRIRQQLQVQVP